jgi:hypothetical protein
MTPDLQRFIHYERRTLNSSLYGLCYSSSAFRTPASDAPRRLSVRNILQPINAETRQTLGLSHTP